MVSVVLNFISFITEVLTIFFNVMAKFIKYFVFNIFPLKIFSLRSKTQEVYKVY